MVSIGRGLAIAQFKSYDLAMQVMQGQLQQRIMRNMTDEVAAIRDKYSGAATASIEEEINRLFDRKNELASVVARVDKALDRFLDVRVDLAELRSLAQEGSAAPFRTKYVHLNSEAGSRVTDSDNLVGRSGNGYWPEETIIADTGTTEVQVTRQYIGNDWAIDLDGGGVLIPDHSDNVLKGAGVTLDMDGLTLISMDGDAVTFSDGTDTYSGTLRRGGGGVLSPWLYNNFATEEDKAEAVADIDAAMMRLLKIERDLKIDEALLSGGANILNGRMENLTAEYEGIQAEELDARQAEIKAVQTKYKLLDSSFAMTANIGMQFIEGMFLTDPWPQNRGVFGTLADSVGRTLG